MNRFVIAARHIVALGAMTGLAACVHPTQFDRYYEREQWSDAAKEFSSDTSLRRNDHELYRAALVFGTPGRPTYKADSARVLLNALLTRFPATSHRDEALARLALLDQLVITQRQAEARAHDLELRIDALTRETRDLRARADSSSGHSDSLRAVIKTLEADRKERDDQLKALRLELQQLKEIDLKPRSPTRPPIKP